MSEPYTPEMGDVVQITEGPYLGYIGVISSVDDEIQVTFYHPHTMSLTVMANEKILKYVGTVSA